MWETHLFTGHQLTQSLVELRDIAAAHHQTSFQPTEMKKSISGIFSNIHFFCLIIDDTFEDTAFDWKRE